MRIFHLCIKKTPQDLKSRLVAINTLVFAEIDCREFLWISWNLFPVKIIGKLTLCSRNLQTLMLVKFEYFLDLHFSDLYELRKKKKHRILSSRKIVFSKINFLANQISRVKFIIAIVWTDAKKCLGNEVGQFLI